MLNFRFLLLKCNFLLIFFSFDWNVELFARLLIPTDLRNLTTPLNDWTRFCKKKYKIVYDEQTQKEMDHIPKHGDFELLQNSRSSTDCPRFWSISRFNLQMEEFIWTTRRIRSIKKWNTTTRGGGLKEPSKRGYFDQSLFFLDLCHFSLGIGCSVLSTLHPNQLYLQNILATKSGCPNTASVSTWDSFGKFWSLIFLLKIPSSSTNWFWVELNNEDERGHFEHLVLLLIHLSYYSEREYLALLGRLSPLLVPCIGTDEIQY